ncbi:50S ribosomal protein L4 [bacterium]|nr:50S ribosomal protein L4 [bacterium]
MATVQVRNRENEIIEELSLPDEVFGAPANAALLYQVVKAAEANQRQGTSAAKTRGEVAGGRHKPYRQKGTGRARQGTIRAGQFRGGGAIFPPVPRSHRQAVPRKVRRAALRQALSLKYAEDALVVVDSLTLAEPKTREMARVLGNLEVAGERVLLVLEPFDEPTRLSARNIPRLEMEPPTALSAHSVLKAGRLVMTKDAILRVAEALRP